MSELRKYTPIDKASKLLTRTVLGVAVIAMPTPDVLMPNRPQPDVLPQEQKVPNPTVSSEAAYITRMYNKGEFLVTRQNTGNDRPDYAYGEGLIAMVANGCQITDIRSINGGNLVRVANPDQCLPQTKTPSTTK